MDTSSESSGNDFTSLHTLPVPEVFRLLKTRPEGFSPREAGERLQVFGPNSIQKIRGKPLYARFLINFTHLMALLLWVAGIVAFIAGLPQLGIAIWMVNVINGLFSFWQEYKAEKATEILLKMFPSFARVLRQGEESQILAEELVPGDIVLLGEGDHISADGRLIEEVELRIDQSTLTGEAHHVKKTAEPVLRGGLTLTEIPNLVFAGTSVASGSGKMVVSATGMRSEFGKIAHLTQSLGGELSPLQKEVKVVTRMVTAVAISAGLLFFLLGTLIAGMNLAESFIFAMGMIVAFVPEGLLPTVTLALAMGVQRMARRHALIKRLSSVETLGCTTVICTDKTGTLTQNEMTVQNIWISGSNFTVTGVGYEPQGTILASTNQASTPMEGDLHEILTAAGLCNNSRLLPPREESLHWTVLGDPTEAALRVAAVKGHVDLEEEFHTFPRIHEFPFDSHRKRMSTIHQRADSWVVYVKGAPKEVLALCTHIRIHEQDCPLTPELQQEVMEVNDDYAREGLRVLGVASRSMPSPGKSPRDYTADVAETDLTFLGLMAMMDPPRPEVVDAVEKCHRAGIRIIMITGDYGLTAESVARKIGIIRERNPRLITGADLDAMSDEDLEHVLEGQVIFARMTPEHKLRVVTVLQDQGHVVAVTGDGVNDAPALKKAAIGVAMGITGTDVAKEAADMVLTDDNFASIVNAVEEGRAVYANIKKFTTYIFTSNTPEAVPFIFFAFSGGRIPLALNIMQILSIDLGTDIMPALALGVEPPESHIMDQHPRNLKEHVITRSLLLRAYLFLGPIQSLAVMTAFFFFYWINGYRGQWLDLPSSGDLYRGATAMALAAVVTTQIGNLFAQRTGSVSLFKTNIFKNRLIWIGIATEVLLIFMLIYIPFLQHIFGTAAFPLKNWVFLFAWAPSLLIADEIRKMLARRKDKTILGGDI